MHPRSSRHDFLTYLQAERQKSLAVLITFLVARKDYGELDESFRPFVNNMEHYLQTGGKWGRPLLVRLAYSALGGNSAMGNLYLGSVATEVFHRFILCHDDLIDRDLSRHGQPTLEKMYQDEVAAMQPVKPMTTYPLAMAMESGDLIQALTYDVVLASGFPLQICLQVIKGFVACAFDTVAGWRLESILKQQALAQVSIDQVVKAMTLVSAQYSVVWPLRLGELYAGRSMSDWVPELETYGLKVGQAFQIRDDILGIFGQTHETGKPVGADLREGKKSLLLLKGYELADPTQKQVLEHANGNEKITPLLLKETQQILIKTGAWAWANDQADKLAQAGADALKPLGSDDNRHTLVTLYEMAHYLAKRNS